MIADSDAARIPQQRALVSEVGGREGVFSLGESLPLFFGGELRKVQLAWRLSGNPSGPTVAALGGISAGRYVYGEKDEPAGWWDSVVGPHRALDAARFQILGIDYLGGSGASTGPGPAEKNFPSLSAYDQARVLHLLLQHLNVPTLHAIVGASYGGMVALAFAQRYPQSVRRIIVISAADRSHPMSTAWRSVQRAIVRYAAAKGEGAEGLKLARALAMATYRTPQEFTQRFGDEALRVDQTFRFPVESYLYARGDLYASQYIPEAFVCLSESIDLHRVNPAEIKVPATLIAVREDQLVPLADMVALRDTLGGEAELVELSSLYGHDAFLKESAALQSVFDRVLQPDSSGKR